MLRSVGLSCAVSIFGGIWMKRYREGDDEAGTVNAVNNVSVYVCVFYKCTCCKACSVVRFPSV